MGGVKEACAEFEAYFVSNLIKEMRKSTLENKSSAEKTFYSMLDEAIGKKIAESGGIGLAKFMERQL
jgi:flagellar protein FlgJ